MTILVINSGSSSVKYQLVDANTGESSQSGRIDRIGEKCGPKNHSDALKIVFKNLGVGETGCPGIHAVGHRVVHGGKTFKESVIATPETIAKVESVSHLAPLHNPANILGVRACIDAFPKLLNVMVFDTAFHSTLEPHVYRYAIPNADYEKLGIRRYGFHGTSHNFVSRRVAEMCGKPREELKIISCHIGNGCSICAIDRGKSVETSMGLTPLEGLVMGTRSGDIDPAALAFLSKEHGFTIEQTIEYLNKKSGLLGLAGIDSCDMRDIIIEVEKGNAQATLAFDVFTHRIIKYVGAYIAVMGGLDAIAFTGGIGNNIPKLRERVINQLPFLNAKIDPAKNEIYCPTNNSQTGEITAKNSPVRTFVICTNEELEIAIETAKLI